MNPKQEKAIEYLLQGKNDSEVARKIGVARMTVNHWRNQDAEFQKELAARRKEVWEEKRDGLMAFYEQAVAILHQTLESQDEKVRIRAELGTVKTPAIQAHLMPEEAVEENEKGDEPLEILAISLDLLEKEGKGVQPRDWE